MGKIRAEWFAGRLAELREASGLTQLQLADKAGVHVRTITHLEAGTRKPTWETALAIADVLKVSPLAFCEPPKK